jgi:ABC-type Fe3+ transport system substrate-binding protein
MFDKTNAAKVKAVVDYALSAEGQKRFRNRLYSHKLIKLNLYKLKRLLY